MSADSAPDGAARFARFLGSELRAYPGRANVMLRCLLTSAIVIVTSMALQVPLLALSLIVVFYVTQANVVLTRIVGMLFIVGSTAAIGTTIVLLKLTYDYPLLRIVAVGLLFFASVYLMRVTKIGVVFFIVGIVVIYGQTFVDQTDQPELLVRSLLWVWVAVNYAIALTLAVNTLFLPAEPARQLEAAMLRQLGAVEAALADFANGSTGAPRPDARDVQTGTLTLQKLMRFVTMRDPSYRVHQAATLAQAVTVLRLYAAVSHLPAAAAGRAASVATTLHGACRALGETIRDRQRPFTSIEPQATAAADDALPGALLEMQRALHAYANRASTPAPAESTAERQRLLAPDAFANPVYAQFALKTLLAAMLGYVFYLATDWQGIHTIMLTCLIVAQPSLGATQQRALLRIGGALVGSACALATVVWVLPRIDSIVGLLFAVLPVIAVGAWIAAGSERIGYAGVQIMFTFSLALLEQFGPSTNLTEIRDRMVGILLGVVLSTLIHATLWPEAEGEALRQRASRLMRKLAVRLRADDEIRPQMDSLWSELGDCETIAARVALEPGWQIGEGQQEGFTVRMQTLLAQFREIVAATSGFAAERDAQHASARTVAACASLQRVLAASLDRYADALATNPPAVVVPTPPDLGELAAACADDVVQHGNTDAARASSIRLLDAARVLANHVSALPAPDGRAASARFAQGTARA